MGYMFKMLETFDRMHDCLKYIKELDASPNMEHFGEKFNKIKTEAIAIVTELEEENERRNSKRPDETV